MFLHLLKYELLTGLRNRQAMFWMLAFPIILGTFFNIAFSGLYSDELFKEIPVAVCTEQENATFSEVMDSLSEGGYALFAPEYLAENKAMKKLENGDFDGGFSGWGHSPFGKEREHRRFDNTLVPR